MNRIRAATYWGLLALMLIVSMYMRMSNLGRVQGFTGDQGRDYIEVMHWIKGGVWPLLGQDRSVGDRSLGPGWFYTLAPAMALSNFDPRAGAATIGMLAILTIFLVADWVRRTTASHAAALVAAGVMAFSTPWTEMGRSLWNPHTLPFGVAALAWLILLARRRPIPCLASALALMAILPQWHTTGFLVDAAALPFLTLAVQKAWPAARSARRRTWLIWGGALAVVLAFLYVPPIIYELKPGPGNLANYFSRSSVAPKPYSGGAFWRALQACDALARLTSFQAFYTDLEDNSLQAVRLRLTLAGIALALFCWMFVAGLRRRTIEWSPAFLALIPAGYALMLFIKGKAIFDYCLIAAPPALLMLGGWTAGRLLQYPRNPLAKLHVPLTLGVLMLLGAGALTLQQAPWAWVVHQGGGKLGKNFQVSQEVAEYIAKDSAGRPFSVELVDQSNFPCHYYYLLGRLGRPPINTEYYTHAIEAREMGERIYLVVPPGMDDLPRLVGWKGPIGEPFMVRNIPVFRIDRATLPPATRALQIECNYAEWTLVAKQ